MPRVLNILSAATLRKLPPGYHNDGGNLVLQVTPAGNRSWVFRYRPPGSKWNREMGLGPLHTVSLAQARLKAAEHRRELLDGHDPIELRRKRDLDRASAAAKLVTFRQAAEDYIDRKSPEWRNPKSAAQWTASLSTYAFPVLGSLDVGSINVDLVLKVLHPIWTDRTETATRVRQRMEKILDFARVEFREGRNPARWAGNLEHHLPKPAAVAKRRHQPALPYAALPSLITTLAANDSTSALALQFTILTAARTGEVIGAKWSEIDDAAKTWSVPADRMKANIEHAVPLTDEALAILERVKGRGQGDGYVFPGGKRGKPLSSMAMLELIKPMALTDADGEAITVHGFRSTFRQWAAEMTSHPREVAEHALAHQLPDKVEAAYQRGTMLAKRRALMDEWSAFAKGRLSIGNAGAEQN